MTPTTELGKLLESRRNKTPISTFAPQTLRITRASYYRILKGQDVEITTLFRIAKALKMNSRSIVLLGYCNTMDVREGANHHEALKLLLRRQRGACYNPGLFRKTTHTIRVLRAIADQKPMVDGRAIVLADLVLAAYFGELPDRIFG